MSLLLTGDIKSNPGHNRGQVLKFWRWNLNSICAIEGITIPLLEAYNTIHHYNILTLSETMLNGSVESESIAIERFRKDIFRNDHSNNDEIGGVCLCYHEGLPTKCRKDHECLQ